MAAGGCSLPLDTMFEKADAEAEQTGSAAPRRAGSSQAAAPSEADLAYARAVATDALARGSKDSSIPWENPHTGAGGNITPLAAAYNEGAVLLPRFPGELHPRAIAGLASGRGLPHGRGEWEVKSLKPLKQG